MRSTDEPNTSPRKLVITISDCKYENGELSAQLNLVFNFRLKNQPDQYIWIPITSENPEELMRMWKGCREDKELLFAWMEPQIKKNILRIMEEAEK